MPPSHRKSGPTVLVVDDEDAVPTLMAEALAGTGDGVLRAFRR